jgi:hypothetical protein
MARAPTTNFVKGFKLWWWALPGSTFEVWPVDGEEERNMRGRKSPRGGGVIQSKKAMNEMDAGVSE